MSKKLTCEEFIKRIENINSNITICGEYTAMRNRVDVKCNVCGHEWRPTADSLSRGYGCPKCQAIACGNRNRMSHETFIDKLNKKNPNIEIISLYKNNKSYVKCQCKIDGYIWSAKPNNLLMGTGCPQCAYYKNRTTKDFVKRMNIVNPDIVILGKYTFMSAHIDVECKICGHKWSPTALKLVQGRGCPICKESKGEKAIRLWLQNHNYDFEYQKKFDDLLGVGNGNLSYDFYVIKPNMLIEYQGEQHRRAVDFYGFGKEFAENQFKKQLEHDRRKRKYADSHNYLFLEIWDYDFDNINSILENKVGGT